MSWRETARRWFVEYNPLYFASAACVFAGVLLVSQGLPEDHFASKIGVAGVTELYGLLLITGAWILRRAGQARPAALLGILGLLFSMDVAFNGERLFSHARTMSLEPGMRARAALPASLVFAALGPLKLLLLARVFRLRGAVPFLAAAGATMLALPLLPYAVEAAAARPSAHVLVFWLGAPLLGGALLRGAWTTDVADEDRVRRLSRALAFLPAAVFVAHASTWSNYPGLGLSPAHAAPYLLVIFFLGAARLRGFPAELAAWMGLLIAVSAATSGPTSWTAGAMALLAGGAALALVLRRGLDLLLPAIVAGFGGAFVLASDVAVPGPAWLFPLSAALLAGAALGRDVRCLLASATSAAAAVVGIDPAVPLLPPATALAALEVAAAGWLIFPRWRAWLPALAVAVALAAGSLLLWREPAASTAWFAATSAACFAAGVWRSLPACKAVGAAGGLAFGVLTHRAWSPHTATSWGFLLLVLGFVFLVVGVAVNLRAAASPPRAA